MNATPSCSAISSPPPRPKISASWLQLGQTKWLMFSMIPSVGIFNFLYMPTARRLSAKDTCCGVVTTMEPATGTVTGSCAGGHFSGNLETALAHAREGSEAAEQAGQRLFARHNVALEGLVCAQLGRVDAARHAAHRALETADDNYTRVIAAEALGQLELALGAPEAVVAHLGPICAFARAEAIAEPGATRFTVDLIEALVELERHDEALEILDWYEGNARRLERASALANCRRCRGLLEAQAGEFGTAVAAYEAALAWHESARIPLDHGRTLLALGALQRRTRRRRDARATLDHALAIFERSGAELWAERTRGELRRISGRAPTTGALTPAEERVAKLVAEGRTNREVAARLFVSDRTVEGHLSRIYGKLGVRHRAELARALATRQSRGIDGSNTRDSPVSTDPIVP